VKFAFIQVLCWEAFSSHSKRLISKKSKPKSRIGKQTQKVLSHSQRSAKNVYLCVLILGEISLFLRCFRDPIRVPRIENRVPRISENYHWVPRI